MFRIKNIVLTIIYWFMLTNICLGSGLASLHVQRVDNEWPQIRVYFELFDSVGQVITGIDTNKVRASIDDRTVNIKKIVPFIESNDGVAYIFLVDISKSLSESEFTQMRRALTTITNDMSSADRAAIITFGEKVIVEQPFTDEKELLQRKINQLSATDNLTYFYEGLAQALEIGHVVDTKIPQRRVIITLTDGEDDSEKGLQQEQVFEKMRLERVPTYAIGLYRLPLTEDKQKHLHTLEELAKFSGGAYYQTGTKSLQDIFQEITAKIKSGFVADINVGTGKWSEQIQSLRISTEVENKSLADSVNIRLPLDAVGTETPGPVKDETKRANGDTPLWIYFGGTFVGALVLILLVHRVIVKTKQ